MSYVTLLEASEIVHRETGIDITVPQLIRAGVVQHLPLCVLLDVKCYSPTHRIRREKKAKELNPDYWRDCPMDSINDADVVYAYGCFVLPPRHVFAYQTNEAVRIKSVSSLDGQDIYFPFVEVSRDALQIMQPHLNAFITHINATQAAQQTAPATDTPTAQTATPAPVMAAGWVTQAQARAREIVRESKVRDRYPSQENLGDTIAAEFRKDGIVGTDGKPLTGATIKRHALKGISSATGKQLSTTIVRGK